MSACLALQDPVKVAFLGPAGTFTHAAARSMFGLAASTIEAPTIDGVFDAVRKGQASFGVVPAENSTEGSVTRTVDALIDGGILIRREHVLEVNHCLLGHPSGLSEIERVYSHPQALAQCRGWLALNVPSAQLVQTPSTAAAAREAEADAQSAAIGARVAAEVYGLKIIRERVQDQEENATRFFLIAREDAPPSGDDKTSLVFSVKDGRGALKQVLEIFDQEEINLTRIESRPSRQRAWDYVFLVDLEGHRSDPRVAQAIARLDNRCPLVRLLGSYPRYRG
jgi:chorismate mutase/prephenate dehydratase